MLDGSTTGRLLKIVFFSKFAGTHTLQLILTRELIVQTLLLAGPFLYNQKQPSARERSQNIE